MKTSHVAKIGGNYRLNSSFVMWDENQGVCGLDLAWESKVFFPVDFGTSTLPTLQF